MTENDEWRLATWEGNRQRQHEEFRALSFREKVAVVEQLGEVAVLLRRRWEERVGMSRRDRE